MSKFIFVFSIILLFALPLEAAQRRWVWFRQPTTTQRYIYRVPVRQPYRPSTVNKPPMRPNVESNSNVEPNINYNLVLPENKITYDL